MMQLVLLVLQLLLIIAAAGAAVVRVSAVQHIFVFCRYFCEVSGKSSQSASQSHATRFANNE